MLNASQRLQSQYLDNTTSVLTAVLTTVGMKVCSMAQHTPILKCNELPYDLIPTSWKCRTLRAGEMQAQQARAAWADARPSDAIAERKLALITRSTA